MAKSILQNSGVKGFDVVLSNLQKELLNIEGGTLKGLLLAAAYIRRETERNYPITPVDLGNLRASWFTTASTMVGGNGLMRKGVAINVKDKFGDVIGTGNFKGPRRALLSQDHINTIAEAQALVCSVSPDLMVMMGYTANYAMAVHEMVDKEFHRPQSGPKWFETAIKRSTWQIAKIIRDNAQIKK
jgi:hypothetical protein